MKSHFELLKLPDFITYLGFFSSVLATFCIFQSYFFIAYILILVQLIADYFDGKLARKMKRKDSLGIHLDNFADFYNIINSALLGLFMGISHISLYIIFPLYLAAAMLRLSNFAVFGVGTKKIYTGVPTTLCTFLITTLLIVNHYYIHFYINIFLILYFTLAILMPSNIKLKKI